MLNFKTIAPNVAINISRPLYIYTVYLGACVWEGSGRNPHQQRASCNPHMAS